ncbi:bifunctional 5,10-methylenetetrahydrofolate dehydrogenase/5,10-methenyltetrahydrofolate cyclohydrolase [Fusibacter paucivorans]|uniref:Bifunctional protein FolD n=1 Tax=Fusibacter paucivorans TaxID=76009 RepID=A0ABS5PP92_9FIRM|nr:bifunctional 5,10-methylenetetrahydrofolate dehydrogenase/5,10-methenyltetrahydrofolate cyclohydrolase [Fusibacter paucivorans]MBS7526993.1 bifunctional 5,10-methylenetetrahydrofolate dehydrogenase/5,10-methenyltetrahydrofolate cyclohydrolase [Fusibacter paucivorans]
MAKLLKGAAVTAALNEQLKTRVQNLENKRITPCLAILRIGERGDDIAYEKGAVKRCDSLGILVKKFLLEADAGQDKLMETIELINRDPAIHGCLMFRPLPKHYDEEMARNALAPSKDIDGITNASLAGVFGGTDSGFPPCTAAAAMEILSHYDIALKGKNAVVIGRSLVIGKPVAMMLIKENATVTICHTKTVDMPAVCQRADVIIAAAGRAKMIDKAYLNENQVVIDVGINVGEGGKLCGDVDFEIAEPIVSAITPVPGGVGTVTTSVLAKHLVEAAERTVR